MTGVQTCALPISATAPGGSFFLNGVFTNVSTQSSLTGITLALTTAINNNTTATNQATTATNQATGGNGAHRNVQPTLVLNAIIKI